MLLSSLGQTGLTGQKGDTGPAGPPGPTAGGVTAGGVTAGGAVYTRWGRTTCPNITGTQLVYAGRAAGSWYSYSGGGANYLCLPDDPNYLRYTNGTQGNRAYLYGAEYDTYDSSPLSEVLNHNVPCAVCYASTRGTVMMMPGKTVCPSSWTREYYGYLMAEQHNHQRSTFECVDRNPQAIPGSASNADGALFHHVEADCYGICPPYTDGRELTCTVCTK